MRKEVKQFAKQMEIKLRENDHKGGWSNCRLKDLWGMIGIEIHELLWELHECNVNSISENITKNGAQKITRECADIANFAMMISDIATKKAKTTP